MQTTWQKFFEERSKRDSIHCGELRFETAQQFYEHLVKHCAVKLSDIDEKFSLDAALVEGMCTKDAKGKTRIDYSNMVEFAKRVSLVGHSCDLYIMGNDSDVTTMLDEARAAQAGNLRYRFGQWPAGCAAPVIHVGVYYAGEEKAVVMSGCKFPFSNFETPEGFGFDLRLPGGKTMRVQNPEQVIQCGVKAAYVASFPDTASVASKVALLRKFVDTHVGVVDLQEIGTVDELMVKIAEAVDACGKITPAQAKEIGQMLPLHADYFKAAMGEAITTGELLDRRDSLPSLMDKAGINARTQAGIYLMSFIANSGFRNMMLAFKKHKISVYEAAAYNRPSGVWLDNSFGAGCFDPRGGPCHEVVVSDAEVRPPAHNALGRGFAIAMHFLDTPERYAEFLVEQ